MNTQKEIRGTFVGERFVFENDGGLNRVIIGDLRTADGALETVKGPAKDGELTDGLCYRFWGGWTNHDKYGRQFHFQNFIAETPIGKGAIVTYLSTRVNGIGSAIASRIYDAFGDHSLEMIRESPDVVANEVKGLSASKAESASQQLQRLAGTERATAELLDVIHGRGFPKTVVADALKIWGAKSAEVIRRNPYHLLRFRGCGFLKVDQLYSDMGKPPGTLKRQALCGHDSIRRDGNGDTWKSVNVIHDALMTKISGAAPNLERTIELMTRGGLIDVRHEPDGRWVSDWRDSGKEDRLAEYVSRILTSDDQPNGWPDEKSLDVSDHQREKLSQAFYRRIGILAGRPGTGKTYTTARVISALLGMGYREHDIAVAAPTGKAALRITQSLAAAGIDITAKTIHSTLEVQKADGSQWWFGRDEKNPLDQKFLFVDESSMLDTNLACDLFAAVGPETSILLIGDTNQLPPVGHGAPLRDLIAAGVPCGELTEIRRNSGRIVSTCRDIVERRRFESSRTTDLEAGENLPHIEDRDEKPTDIAALIDHLAAKHDVDPLTGIQVLVATNRLRKSLNLKLQDALNPTGARCKGTPFRVGDKVINLKNGSFEVVGKVKDPDSVSRDDKGAFVVPVANGEQGIVLSVSAGRMVVRLDSRDMTDVLVRWKRSQEEDGDDEHGPGCSWDLAYAISVHKSQGSEWPIAIVMVDSSGGRIQTRNWIYTAISRAKTLCVTVGKREAINAAVRRDGIARKTFLAELIQEKSQSLESRKVAEFFAFETDNSFWGGVLEGVTT